MCLNFLLLEKFIMTKCIVLRGLSWIWKSTRAEEQICKFPEMTVVNRDTLRLQNPWVKERDIKQLQYDALKAIFKAWQDCILDNTHCLPWSLESAIAMCKSIWFETEVKDFMTWQPIKRHEEASARNFNRPTRVPQCVIDKMFLANYKISDVHFRREMYIFDLDWTLANLEHRLHYVKWEWKKDWKNFYAEVLNDSVIENVARIWHSLSSPTICKVILSGRSNQCAFETEEWLSKNWFKYDFILMRDSWDKRDDTDVKRDMYNMCLKWNKILWVFDDRRRIIDMRQEEGVFTFDVSQGKVF